MNYQNDTPGIIQSNLNYTILMILRLRVLENTSEALNDDVMSAACKCGVFSDMFQLPISTELKLTIIQYMM